MFLKLFGSIAGTLAAYALYEIARIAYQELSFPLRHLTGLKANHKLHKQLMRDMTNGAILQEQWIHQYGKTFKHPFFFGLSRLYTLDMKALNHTSRASASLRRSERKFDQGPGIRALDISKKNIAGSHEINEYIFTTFQHEPFIHR
ncbi:hypothetical protein R3P38DRAFT_3296616 [Favolaschia claudopus]|uniref:Uncharacterized protein n=1 Tax=Favolaschia claudopus TaxID=2862362 RepID=A0AAV9Z9Z7_9AGAR